MKNVISIVALFISSYCWADTKQHTDTVRIGDEVVSVPENVINEVKDIVTHKEEIHRLKEEKLKEEERQLKLLREINHKLQKLKKLDKDSKVIKEVKQVLKHTTKPKLPEPIETNTSNKIYVVKDGNSEGLYAEEIPRKWLGRLFTGDSIRYRLFRFDEKGNKIYVK